jgi:putative ABC transport system permease protein
MDYKELVLLAVETLKSNVARTLLTTLGIVIGIASVIIVISLGQGTTASVVENISSFGVNVITVSPGRTQRRPGQGGSSSTVTTLVYEDAQTIADLAYVEAVSAVVRQTKQLVADGEDTNATINGVEASYEGIQSLTMLDGFFLDESDVNSHSKVVILGDSVVEELFGEGAQVVGQTLRIDGKTFRIKGVVIDSEDVFIPLTTAQKILFGQDYLNSISVAAIDSELVESLMVDIGNTLLLEHDIDEPDEADFSLRSAQEMIATVSSITGSMTAMLSGIAAISLVVGGIGIMNIMLVTVTERTKEIGLLKAIGAKKEDILVQFLIESVVMTMLGGLVGMILGIGVAYILADMINVPFVVSMSSVLMAVGVSAAVGIIFGWYPANKAAKLHPVDALRYE